MHKENGVTTFYPEYLSYKTSAMLSSNNIRN
jgi:hypothetical protein